MNAVLLLTEVRAGKTLLIGGRQVLPPSGRGVIVVRAGVRHGVGVELVRKVNVRAGIPEAELHDTHAWNLEALAEGSHVFGDHAEIFRDKRQIAELAPENREQVVARTRHPAAVHSGRLTGRGLPISLESTEVVEADVIAKHQRPADPLHPPVIAAVAECVPLVERIAPALPG